MVERENTKVEAIQQNQLPREKKGPEEVRSMYNEGYYTDNINSDSLHQDSKDQDISDDDIKQYNKKSN